MNRNSLGIKKIAITSMLLAIGIVIDLVTGLIPGLNLSMPLGGRFINLALLPILLIGVWIGPVYGLFGSILFGVFSFFIDGYALAYFASNLSEALLVFLLDYVVPFGILGLTGFFKGFLYSNNKLIFVTAFIMIIRWLSSTIVGSILWVSYATSNSWTTDLLNNVGNQAFIYSGIYNITYTLTTYLVLVIILISIRKQLLIIKENYLLK